MNTRITRQCYLAECLVFVAPRLGQCQEINIFVDNTFTTVSLRVVKRSGNQNNKSSLRGFYITTIYIRQLKSRGESHIKHVLYVHIIYNDIKVDNFGNSFF